ncbi:MAG: ABC transporter ATP-binding protein [Thermoplasmatota archaeon]
MSSMPVKETAPIIETTSLSKDYQGLMALNSVDLAIPTGAVGLLGPNGAGKSTLIKCLLGLVVPSSGTSKVLGLSTEKLQTHIQAREKVGYVPENDCLIPNMDAVSFVKYMGEISGLPPMDAMQRAHEVLHYVGIGDERYRRISTYSTGMKQKIKLAQAIVHDPELIILDEPTNGMDPKGRQEMLDLIKDIHLNHGKNILLSSHLLPDVEYICEHVVILNNGSVLVQGMIKELTTTSDEYEIRIKGDEEQFRKVLTEMKLSFQKKGSFFMVRSKEDLLVRLYPAVKDKDIQIRHATRYRQTLEDIFMGRVTAGGGKQ